VLFVLAPGGEDTRHVVNADFLRKMKKHAVLVNAARGTLVDSDALAQALREEWIWGAGLDVVEGEPHIGADHPLVREPRYVQPVYAVPFLRTWPSSFIFRFVLGKKYH
jgi:glyoxylate/hydroxypyruvate reductase